MDIIWDLLQQQQIRQLKKEATDTKHKTKDNVSAVRDLQDQVDRLTLVCRAMWEVVREHNNIAEHELTAMVQKIDLLDGQADGKYKQGKQCTACNRIMNRRHTTCFYCGAEDLRESAFDSV